MRVLLVPEVYRPDDALACVTLNDAITWVDRWLAEDDIDPSVVTVILTFFRGVDGPIAGYRPIPFPFRDLSRSRAHASGRAPVIRPTRARLAPARRV